MTYTEKVLRNFVAAMDIRLTANQAEKGDYWIGGSVGDLQRKLDKNIKEYGSMERDMENPSALVDIAIYCMMLHHRHINSQVNGAAKANRLDLQILLQHAKEEVEGAVALLDKDKPISSEDFRLVIHLVTRRLNAVSEISLRKGEL